MGQTSMLTATPYRPLTIIIILFFLQKSIPFLKVIYLTIFRPGAIPTHRVGTAQKRERKKGEEEGIGAGSRT